MERTYTYLKFLKWNDIVQRLQMTTLLHLT